MRSTCLYPDGQRTHTAIRDYWYLHPSFTDEIIDTQLSMMLLHLKMWHFVISVGYTLITIERTAADILRHYERTNRAVGKDRDAAIKLLRLREAMEAKESGRVELALEV